MTGSPRVQRVVWDRAGNVPVVWQESPGLRGLNAFSDPVVAALGFRVGRADEPLARSGLTHLVEHLAVAGLGERLYEYDGFVNGTMTWFGFRGTPDEAVEYFGHVGRSLADLPVDRLAAELGVLRAEEARRSTTTAGRCLLLRYGARGWGTYDLPQYGLQSVTADRVREWARSWFGAGNAVFWMTGPPPDRLVLALPPGPARPEPAAVPLAGRRFPAWTTHRQAVTAASMLVPRTAEAVAAVAILQARLRHVLRDVDGSCYDVSLALDDLDDATTHVLLTADGPSTSVVEALAAVTDALASDGATDEELAYQLARYVRRAADPAMVLGSLAARAGARACGWTERAPEDELAGLERAGPASIAAAIVGALGTALYLVPVGTPVPATLALPLEEPAVVAVTGRAHRPARSRRGDPRRLVAGADGVSELNGERSATVRTDDATAVLAWRNGARLVVGADGTALPVEPRRWIGAARAIAAFDAAVPEALVVPMGDRPAWAFDDTGPERRRWRARVRRRG